MGDKKKLLVEIPLKPRANGDAFVPMEGRAPLELEYASRMLEAINAYPSAQNTEWILKKLPLEKALVVPMKTRDVVMVVPGAGNVKNMDLAQLMGVSEANDEYKDEKRQKEERLEAQRQQEMEDAKDQEILAEEQRRREAQQNIAKGRRVSWCTVHTYDFLEPIVDRIGAKEVQMRLFRAMLKPLSVTKADLSIPVEVFNDKLVEYVPSVKKDATGHLFTKLQHFLESDACMQLYGLLAHYVYWNIIHPCVRRACVRANVIEPTSHPPRTSLLTHIANTTGEAENEEGGEGAEATFNTDTYFDNNSIADGMTLGGLDSLASQSSLTMDEKEVLFVHLQQCYVLLKTVTGANRTALATMHQGLICCCHFAVDVVLCEEYQWFDPERAAGKVDVNYRDPQPVNALRLEMRRLMHQAISDLVDPSRLYTDRFLELSAVGKTKISIKRNSANDMNQYAMSVAVRALLRGEARDAQTRIMLHYGDKKPYANVPGLSPAAAAGPGTTGFASSTPSNPLESGSISGDSTIGARTGGTVRNRYKGTQKKTKNLEDVIVEAGSPHPLYGGATNTQVHKDNGFAWVRKNFRYRTVKNSNRGARGPHGRVDGVPDSGTHDDHVGEMLRIATVPAKVLASPKKKKHTPPPLKCLVAPGGNVVLARTKKGHVMLEKSVIRHHDPTAINVAELDISDLFGSYEKLRKQRDDYLEATGQPVGSSVGMPPDGLDAPDSLLSTSYGGLSPGKTKGPQSLAVPRSPRLFPLSSNGKRDLLNLIVEKTQKPYLNPSLCMTDRVDLLNPN